MSWSALRQAIRFSRRGQHAEALQRLAALDSWLPEDPRRCFQSALVEMQADRPEAALARLDRVAHLPPKDNLPGLLYRCLALGDCRRWTEAWNTAQQLLAACPTHQFKVTLLCYLHLGAERTGEALALLRSPHSWSALRPELSPFPPLLSRLLLLCEEVLLPLEVPALRRSQAVALEEADASDESEAESGKGGWLSELRSLPAHLSRTVKEAGSLPRALGRSLGGAVWQRRGVAHWESALGMKDGPERDARLDAAVEAHRQGNLLEPDQFRGAYHLGEALLYAACRSNRAEADPVRLQEAEASLLRSARREGVNPYLLYYLGRCAFLSGRPEASVTYLEDAVKRFAKFPEAHYALGQAYLLMGQRQLAREWLERCLSSDFLPGARERLDELGGQLEAGRLSEKRPLPLWPPTEDSGPTDQDPLPPQSPTEAVATPGLPESHRSVLPSSPLESHATFPVRPGPPGPADPSTPADGPISPTG